MITITAKRHMETNCWWPLVGRLSVRVCRRRVAGAQWLAGGVCLALSPTISCATQSPCHKNRLLCLTVALIFAFGYVFGPNLDQTAPPPRLTACLPQMLPSALGDSVVAPVHCRPFYDQHSDSLLLLTQILRCWLSLIWTVEIPRLLKLVPWLLLWFQGFGRMGEKYEASPPGLCSMATLAAAHRTDRCFRQGDNTQHVGAWGRGVYPICAPALLLGLLVVHHWLPAPRENVGSEWPHTWIPF